MPSIAEIRSVSIPGRSIIHAELKQSVEQSEFDQQWDKLRDQINAVRDDLQWDIALCSKR